MRVAQITQTPDAATDLTAAFAHHQRERLQIRPPPATQGPVRNKATITFGNLADIGKALRVARKIRPKDVDQQAEAFQPTTLDLRRPNR